MAKTMKAWQYTAVGDDFSTLYLNQNAIAPTQSSLTEGQLLVEVISACLNPIDYKISEAGIIGKMMVKLPATPGLDFCGRIIGAHKSETNVKEGQLVFGAFPVMPSFGTLGQFVVVPRGQYALLPEGLSPSDAAAIGTAGLTAYQSLLPSIVKPGSKILINGGSGGCGTFSIQFAKALGAQVTVTCSTANIELCRSLGAEEVIDYKKTDFVTELVKKGEVYDLVIDNVGTPDDLYERSSQFLKTEGTYAQVSMQPTVGGMASLMKKMLLPGLLGGGKRKFHFVANKSNTEDLEQMSRWIVEGKVKVVTDEVFSFDDVPAAFAKLKTGRAKGRIVIKMLDQ